MRRTAGGSAAVSPAGFWPTAATRVVVDHTSKYVSAQTDRGDVVLPPLKALLDGLAGSW